MPGARLATGGPWLLAGALALTAVGAFGMGFWNAWVRNQDADMQLRVAEYAAFRVGDYPNPAVDRPQAGPAVPYSAYPPYAFPMFAPFFEPGGLLQGRLLVEVLTIAAVVLMGSYGNARLKPFGSGWAVVGSLAGVSMATNGMTLSLGQFSTVSAGLTVLQLILLERRAAIPAGLCWAGGMIKPQIALPFAALFLVNRQARGLACGIVVLAALSAIAVWWTDLSPGALANHWLFRMRMDFAEESGGVGIGHVAAWLGWNPRVMQFLALGALVVVAVAAAAGVRFVHRDVVVPDLLPLAGICAVLGRVLVYHRHYDNVMLFPLLLAWLCRALAAPTAANAATAAAVGLTLWIPQRVQDDVPFIEFLVPAIWIVAALRLARVALTEPATRGCGDA
jgi:hypothetical protein